MRSAISAFISTIFASSACFRHFHHFLVYQPEIKGGTIGGGSGA